MAQAGSSTTTAVKYVATPEMTAFLALILALDLKADDKRKPRPSVHVLEALRVFAGAS